MAYEDYIEYSFAIARGLTNHTVTILHGITETLSATAGFILSPVNKFAMTTPSINTAGAQYMRLTSTDATDNTAGVGAVNVNISGIGPAGSTVSEDLAISGQVPKTSTNLYVAINRMYVSSVGSAKDNAGTIYATGNADSTTTGAPDNTSTAYSVIAIGANISQDFRYLTPIDYTGYVKSFIIGHGAASVINVDYRVFSKKSGQPLQELFHSHAGIGASMFTFDTPIKIDPQTYIWAQVSGGASATSADITAEMILIKE